MLRSESTNLRRNHDMARVVSSWLICVRGCWLIAHPDIYPDPLFPHPRADAAATEHGAANRSPPMAETVVCCRATDALSQRLSESTRARPPPNDGVEKKRQRRWWMDCRALPDEGGHGSTPKNGQTPHSVHVLDGAEIWSMSVCCLPLWAGYNRATIHRRCHFSSTPSLGGGSSS